ncbi:uncharacterized protein LAESUDRAFT_764010 [Laetiporus sulphureus 93-53]|uniref:Uncharacterized protein n=1 Tax=Laetiporus sulphureus 93-53 TaxID=1314785 RepID=A0A165BJS7_9APHY|nr:uncharacterized protein LAESUDRAFT_764010 [Laetiporus sulphureus 93-53]KZT01191.1 hypothetical protein LAESUDRAFT_764010 [Laetiporus sulphureus 93-53]
MTLPWMPSYRRPTGAYELLPAPRPHAKTSSCRRSCHIPRWAKIAAVVFLLIAVFLIRRKWVRGLILPWSDEGMPPLYSEYHAHELGLPQHRLDSDVQPAGANTKYLWVANHVWRSGWGNAMQEQLLNHYIAYRAGRSFVFGNYTWWRHGLYSSWNGKPIPAQIPYSALIQGPTVGAPMRTDPTAPLAVVKEFWDEVCPHPVVVRSTDVVKMLGGRTTTAELLIDKWVEMLNSIESPCVEVKRSSPSTFDIYVFGDPDRLLDAWPGFSTSPILTEFGWAPLVERAFDANRETISPFITGEPYLSLTPFTGTGAERYTTIRGLLALHVRRGDFEEHCRNLADWDAGYTGYNAFPALPDKFVKPRGVSRDEKREFYREHCYPSVEEIVRRAEEVRRTQAGRGLRSVYVMTNAPASWVEELKAALHATRHWTHVASSRDLVLSEEQKHVAQAVDMLVGERAQVVVGNGFSSLTGQITMLRMANGVSPDTNRHWRPAEYVDSEQPSGPWERGGS